MSPNECYLCVRSVHFAKKGNPKKASPIPRPFGVPCAARQAGRLRNWLRHHALRAQTVLADCPRLASAARRWTEGNSVQTQRSYVTPVVLAHHPVSPLRRFGLAGELGVVGCALFEFRGSLRFVQAARASCADAQFASQSEGTRRAARRGALLFGYFISALWSKCTKIIRPISVESIDPAR